MNFSVASPLPPSGKFIVLQKDVVGEDCDGQYGSYAVAVGRAIAGVDGANALINVKLSRREIPIARICVSVIGDAVML